MIMIVLPVNAVLDFDSRLHLNGYSSCTHARMVTTFHLQVFHRARFTGLRKSQAHLDPSKLVEANSKDPATLPTIITMDGLSTLLESHLPDAPIYPVYSIPNSLAKPIERILSYELKKLFGCHFPKNWKSLETLGTGLHTSPMKATLHSPSEMWVLYPAAITTVNSFNILPRPSTQ
jgi:hypothetical protein